MKHEIKLSEKAQNMIRCYESFSKVSKDMDVSYNTLAQAINGTNITMKVALNIMRYLRLKFEHCFDVKEVI